MIPIIEYVKKRPFKFFLYLICGVYLFHGVRWVAVSIAMVVVAWRIDHSNKEKAKELKKLLVNWMYISESLDDAAPEMLKRYGGRRAYKQALKFTLSLSKSVEPVEKTL